MNMTIKKPLSEDELKKLLGVEILPNVLLKKPVYRSNYLSDFYVGMKKIDIGDTEVFAYKTTIKNIRLLTPGIYLQIRRNNKMIRPFNREDEVADIIVIILDVKQEFFVLKDTSQVNFILIGIFSKEEVDNYIMNQEEIDKNHIDFIVDIDREE